MLQKKVVEDTFNFRAWPSLTLLEAGYEVSFNL